MPLVTKKTLVCDRCGEETDAGGGFEPGIADDLPEGWGRADRGRLLCPACYPGYETMLARHLVELEDFVAGRL